MNGPSLASFGEGYRALVFGATGGVGGALVAALAADPRCEVVHAAARRPVEPAAKVTSLTFDLEDEGSIADAVAMAAKQGPLDLVIVATGLLHEEGLRPERTWRAIEPAALDRAFRVNAVGPALVAKHALGALARDRKAVFAALSARVGSIGDNQLGGWHAYRASKAALNMLVKNFAIELGRRSPQAVCLSLHPGTVATELSQPFQANVPTGKLFTPQRSAASLLSVIDAVTPEDSGGLFAWDGSPIPF